MKINFDKYEVETKEGKKKIRGKFINRELSLIDFNTGSIISEYNLTSSKNNNIYKKGHFLNNSNIVLINSKNMISLIDFRFKGNKLNDLLPDYNFNFNEVILSEFIENNFCLKLKKALTQNQSDFFLLY